MGLFLALSLAIAAGIIIAYAVAMTFRWLQNKITTLLQNRKAKKAVAADLEKMANECSNTMSLNSFLNQGYTDVVAAIDNSGNIIGDVEVIKDTAGDYEVDKLYGREGMVVVTN